MSHLRIIKIQTDSGDLGQDLRSRNLTSSWGWGRERVVPMLLAHGAHLEQQGLVAEAFGLGWTLESHGEEVIG